MRQSIRSTIAAAALLAFAGLSQAAVTAEKPTAKEATTPTTVKQTQKPSAGTMPDTTIAANSAPANAAVGSGSGGTVEGRKAGSTNANSDGEPVQSEKSMKSHKGQKADKRAHGARMDAQSNAAVGSGSGGTVEGRVAGTTNSNSKGEPAKTP